MELTTVIRTTTKGHPGNAAVICDGVTHTYAELYERSCRLANALSSLGLQPGDRVATLGDNSPESIEQVLGLALGGYVRSSLYTHNSAETNVYLLNLVEATAALVQRKHYDAIAPYLAGADALRHVLVFDGDAPDGAVDYEQSLLRASSADPNVQLSPDAPRIIRFSAGTTGKPKGIMHTVSGFGQIGEEMAHILPTVTAGDRYLAAGPLAHAAFLPLFGLLAAAGTIVVMRAFDPESFLSLTQEHRCTTTVLVPTMIQLIVKHPAAATADLTSLRAVLYGAAPISERTLEKAHKLWGRILYQVYGQSEAVPLTVLGPDDHVFAGSSEGRKRLRSAGRPTGNCRIRIVDPDGHELPHGEVGEIAARTPAAMTEIWRDPQATAERILPDGSVLTRDMGYLDEDGYLFLVDRKEDMIISGGFNIWPTELENALASHPGVAEVAVVGVAHEKWGETPKAAIVLRAGHDPTEQELIDWSADKLGSVKRVTSVVFVDELPKTPLGKVLRRAVRDRVRESDRHTLAGA